MKRYLITNHLLLNFVIFFSIFLFSLFYYSPFYVYAYSNCSGSDTDGCCYNTAPSPTEGYCDEHGITNPLDPLCKCQAGLECVDCNVDGRISCDPGGLLYCVGGNTCGVPGNQCCDSLTNRCNTGSVWYNNIAHKAWLESDGIANCTCVNCGDLNAPCCISNGSAVCNGSYTCNVVDFKCEDITNCGRNAGDPCCPGGTCEGSMTCDTATDKCINPHCGALGEPCCISADPCFGNYCVNGTCQEDSPRPREMVYTGPVIESLQELLGPVTKMLYYGGLAIGVFFIILAGYRLMVSEGDPQKTKAAQEQLTSAIIGIIFILLSVTILRVIINQIIGEGI